jgi:hypothetical protein
MVRQFCRHRVAGKGRDLGCAFATLFLANLLFAPEETVIVSARADSDGPQCCVNAMEVAVGSNNGWCTFQGLCNNNATAAADCFDSQLTGQVPCSQSTGQTGWVDAYCQSGSTGATCTLATTSSPKHTWHGSCCAITITGPDQDDNYSCVCNCCIVWGALSSDPPVSYQQCASLSTICSS